MNICYTSPSVKGINQGMIYTNQMIDYRRKYPVLSAFVFSIPFSLAINFSLRRRYYVNNQH